MLQYNRDMKIIIAWLELSSFGGVYRIKSINESFVLSATSMDGSDFTVGIIIRYSLKKVS